MSVIRLGKKIKNQNVGLFFSDFGWYGHRPHKYFRHFMADHFLPPSAVSPANHLLIFFSTQPCLNKKQVSLTTAWEVRHSLSFSHWHIWLTLLLWENLLLSLQLWSSLDDGVEKCNLNKERVMTRYLEKSRQQRQVVATVKETGNVNVGLCTDIMGCSVKRLQCKITQLRRQRIYCEC